MCAEGDGAAGIPRAVADELRILDVQRDVSLSRNGAGGRPGRCRGQEHPRWPRARRKAGERRCAYP